MPIKSASFSYLDEEEVYAFEAFSLIRTTRLARSAVAELIYELCTGDNSRGRICQFVEEAFGRAERPAAQVTEAVTKRRDECFLVQDSRTKEKGSHESRRKRRSEVRRCRCGYCRARHG